MDADGWYDEHTGPEVEGTITKLTPRGYGFIESKPVHGNHGDTVFAHHQRFQLPEDREQIGWHGVEDGTELAFRVEHTYVKNQRQNGTE